MTERGASGRKGQGQSSHMLSTAVRIHLDPHKNVKVQPRLLLPTPLARVTACLVLTASHPQEFLVTLRLHRATLRHYITLPEQSWHSQVSEGGTGRQIARLGGGQGQRHGLGWAGSGG